MRVSLRSPTFHLAEKTTKELSEAQTRLKIPNHSLVIDCVTRWRSMISRVLEQEDASPMIFKGCPQLSSRFTDMLSGEEKVTIYSEDCSAPL